MNLQRRSGINENEIHDFNYSPGHKHDLRV